MMSLRTSALAIIAVYWTMLILGMASCIAMRADASIAAIWTGTVAGTVLGHALALFNTRSWFALLTVLVTAAVVGPSAPGELSASTLWLAFIPAALCAFWSLGDRTTLVAFWFPAVIWMLSILDHGAANGMPDNSGIALLGALALLFLVFLRVRESRRVVLWSSVAAPATTLAVAQPQVLLKERPGFRLARTGWALVASALAFGGTVWLAPRLWHPEQLAPKHEVVAGHYTGHGLPCCPIVDEVETGRARVKEYFSIGRGHDMEPTEQVPHSCRRCEHDEQVAGEYNQYGQYGSYSGAGNYEGSYVPNAVAEPRPETYGYTTYVPTGTETVANNVGSTDPMPSSPYPGAQITYEPPTYDPPTYSPPTYDRPSYTPPSVETPPTVDTPTTATSPTTASPTPSEPTPVTPQPRPVEQPGTPTAPPAVASPPPVASPPAPESHVAAQPDDAATPTTTHESPVIGRSFLQWVGVILAAALLMQLMALALRPLRRYVTLRHLREPFWEETVDQRVSNAWQLALVGLRDAGWRSDSQESPRELAKRVGIADVEQCAQILERARHGIGIDAEDLATMTTAADSAYRDARSRLGLVARAVTWLRWPLT